MTDLSDTQALARAAAAPGVEPHDSPTMTQTEQKALWDAFFEVKARLEAANWPLVRVIREHDGSHTLACPWCDTTVAVLAEGEYSPAVHALGVGFETTGVLEIELVRLPSLVQEVDLFTRMTGESTPATDLIGFSCDNCDGTIRIPGEREW